MKSTMTFDEAVMDPNRPLSLTPREWMYSVEAKLAEEEELIENAAKRIAKEQSKPEPTETGLEKIDMGIDQMISGVQLVMSGIQDSRMTDLDPKTRKVIEKIKDLMETAISPYLADIINQSDSLEAKEDSDK